MGQNYDFLRSFTIDGKETKHLFQIAKLNIPFLSKENEFFQVGNTDGKKFRNTRLGDYTLSIDGFIIKDNTGKTVPQVMDELKALVNSDEPQKLVFDIFPDRYFNAIFTGAEEYDATDLKYTPLTLTFDVPDGLAHQIEPNNFTNVYSTGTNLVLDSEFNNMNKYLNSWVLKLDEKYNDSNIIRADFTNGYPVGVVERNDQWLYQTPRSGRRIGNLKKGDSVSFSVYVRVNTVDSINKYAGSVVLDEYTDGKKNGISHFVRIPNTVNTNFVNYGEVVQIVGEKTNGIGLQLGAYGLGVQIDFTKPMMSLLPPLAEKVVDPVVGATLYSNSLDFGDYDYSGRANLFLNLDFSKLSKNSSAITEPPAYVKDGGSHFVLDFSDASANGVDRTVYIPAVGRLEKGATYTATVPIMISDDFATKYGTTAIYPYCVSANNAVTRVTSLYPDDSCRGKWGFIKKTFTVPANVSDGEFTFFQVYSTKGQAGKLYIGYDIKLERGWTATPYQPNLLDAPYYLSKVPLGENIITSKSYDNSKYLIGSFDINKTINNGDKLTFTIQGTKPANKQFGMYIKTATGAEPEFQGFFTPVEGLTDVWSSSIVATISQPIGSGATVVVYQLPPTSQVADGPATISWAKLEKGDTRTPNIDFYKYRGLHSYPSTNPTEYAWEYDPSYYRAINYVPSGYAVGDVIRINNNGTYRSNPIISFVMNGENGLVGLLNENGSVIQFGNPEDVDTNTTKVMEYGLNEDLWGNTLPSNATINSDFKTVYPYTPVGAGSLPNTFRGIWSMTDDINSAVPIFNWDKASAWHGPSMVFPIKADSNNQRTEEISTHTRFIFNNKEKGQRGRIEFTLMDLDGNKFMSAVVRDSTISSNQLIVEFWYKDTKLKEQFLDRKKFNTDFYEMNMDRLGDTLVWRLVKVRRVNETTNDAEIAEQYKFNWTLPSVDKTPMGSYGVWCMRYQSTYAVRMGITDINVKWNKTDVVSDIKNFFQDGDIVDINTNTRQIFINGVVNNQLNVVGNQWEGFTINPGDTIIQPIVSSWANMADVFVEFRETYL